MGTDKAGNFKENWGSSLRTFLIKKKLPLPSSNLIWEVCD